MQGLPDPATAVLALNRAVFAPDHPGTGVRYSTARPKADQSPYESEDCKLASCTGLSILLVAACRACGIPARFVGTPRWTDNSGNHSWVEVFVDGDCKMTILAHIRMQRRMCWLAWPRLDCAPCTDSLSRLS